MSLSLTNFNRPGKIAWRWPLTIGLPVSSGIEQDIMQELQGYKYISRFTNINESLRKASEVNMLLFPEGSEAAFNMLSKNNWKTDLIVIAEPDESKIKEDDPWLIKIKELLGKTKSSGLFVVKKDDQFGAWLNEIIVNLSHNQDFPKAIGTVSNKGIFYYDKKLEKETTLDHTIKCMVSELEKSFKPAGTEFVFNTNRTGNKLFTPKTLAEWLKNQSPNFQYNFESEEATDIAEIFTELDRHYKGGPFALGKKSTSRSIKPADSGDSPTNAIPVNNTDKETAPETAAETGDTDTGVSVMKPRFLQAKIADAETVQMQEADTYLLPDHDYLLRVRIGEDDKNWKQATGGEIEEKEIFGNKESQEELIELVFQPLDGKSQADQKRIKLPRYGNSNMAMFQFRTGIEGVFTGLIEAYHNSTLLQRISLRARVRKEDGNKKDDVIALDLIYSSGKSIAPLHNGPEFERHCSVRTDEEGKTSLSEVYKSEYIGLSFSGPLDDLMEEIRAMLQKAIMNIDLYPENIKDENNTGLLRTLAIKGNKLFVQHLGKRKLDGPLQIVTNKAGFTPLDFVYEDGVPALNAQLCDHAVEALEEGKCRGCFDKTQSQAPFICPFGFWGIKEIIERSFESKEPINNDYLVKKSQPTEERITLNILDQTQHAYSKRVDAVSADSSGLVKALFKTSPVEDWDEWKTLAQKNNPDSMLLIVHVEKNDTVNEDQVEIGDKHFLLQNFFDTAYIKPLPEKRSPFMIVLGCKVNDTDKPGFDISNKLMQEGAAIVISNFTKISGRRAASMAVELVKYLRELGKEGMTTGQAILETRRYLLSKGIMTGLSLVAYGDAKWKIKTS